MVRNTRCAAVQTCRGRPLPEDEEIPWTVGLAKAAWPRGSPLQQETPCCLPPKTKSFRGHFRTSRLSQSEDHTELQHISEVPHGVGRLPQSGVQLVHARVHPLEGLHVKQRLEM